MQLAIVHIALEKFQSDRIKDKEKILELSSLVKHNINDSAINDTTKRELIDSINLTEKILLTLNQPQTARANSLSLENSGQVK